MIIITVHMTVHITITNYMWNKDSKLVDS